MSRDHSSFGNQPVPVKSVESATPYPIEGAIPGGWPAATAREPLAGQLLRWKQSEQIVELR